MAAAQTAEPTETPHRPKYFLTRLLRLVFTVFFILVLGVGCYNTITKRLATRYDATQQRHADTGILLGAEPFETGPRDAEKAVLFVHGFVGAPNNFWELPRMLGDAGVYSKVMLLPGHGTTPADFAATPPEDLIMAVLRELRALKKDHERVYLVGHSMGSTLCVLAASMEEVDGVVLGAPYFGVTQQWYYVLPVEFWSKVTGPLIHRVYKSDRFLRVKDPEAKKKILSYHWIPSKASRTLQIIGERGSDPDTLAEVQTPVLLIHARDDFAASPKEAQIAFDRLGSEDKTLLWLDHSDHHIYWDYDRDEVAQAVLNFVETH
jgi:carboxylesterase